MHACVRVAVRLLPLHVGASAVWIHGHRPVCEYVSVLLLVATYFKVAIVSGYLVDFKDDRFSGVNFSDLGMAIARPIFVRRP